MKLLQQLNEHADQREEMVELIATVKRAGPFFKQRGAATELLYRGIRSDYTNTGIKYTSPRPNRRPSDSSSLLHAALDRRLKEQFGHPYRSNALFVTPSAHGAQTYGSVKIALPLDEFQFVWSPNSADAYAHFNSVKLYKFMVERASDRLAYELLADFQYDSEPDGSFFVEISKDEEAMILFNQWMDQMYADCQYTSADLPAALSSTSEVMIRCEQLALIGTAPLTFAGLSVLRDKFDLRDRVEVGTSKLELINVLASVIHKL